LAEVLLRLQRVRRQDPDVDEVAEVAEVVDRLEVVRQCVVVPLRDLLERRRAHRSLEVDVQLDLRVWFRSPQVSEATSRAPRVVDERGSGLPWQTPHAVLC